MKTICHFLENGLAYQNLQNSAKPANDIQSLSML